MKIGIIILAFLVIALSSVATITTTIITDNETNMGGSLPVVIQISTDAVDNISGLPCTILVNSSRGTMFFESYDSIFNNPPALKTNAGGFAYYNIPISTVFVTDVPNTLTVDCNGNRNITSFVVHPYIPNDVIATFFATGMSGGAVWFLAIFIFVVFVGFIAYVVKKFK